MLRFLFLLWSLVAPAVAAPDPSVVEIGAYVNDIQNVDLKTHSYSVDLYVWFRWNNPKFDPADSLEFVNPYDLWGHVKKLDYVKPDKLPDGSRYQVLRNQGRFSRKLLLYDYPFDKQTIVIEFEDQRMELSHLNYQVAAEGISINPDLIIPGFNVGKPKLTVAPKKYPTNFGDPRNGRGNVFSEARIEIPIERPILPYLVKLLVPIVCVVLCSILIFLFSPSYVDARVGIGITALLTIVALQMTLNEDLPEVDYLVLMDKIYLLSYLCVIAALGLVVRSTRLLNQGNLARAERFDRRSLVVLSLVYVALMAGIIVPRMID